MRIFGNRGNSNVFHKLDSYRNLFQSTQYGKVLIADCWVGEPLDLTLLRENERLDQGEVIYPNGKVAWQYNGSSILYSNIDIRAHRAETDVIHLFKKPLRRTTLPYYVTGVIRV